MHYIVVFGYLDAMSQSYHLLRYIKISGPFMFYSSMKIVATLTGTLLVKRF